MLRIGAFIGLLQLMDMVLLKVDLLDLQYLTKTEELLVNFLEVVPSALQLVLLIYMGNFQKTGLLVVLELPLNFNPG